jgi:GST-like protein
MYLAEKTGKLMPSDTRGKYNVIQWLMFQMASVGPMLGQAHHFRVYAPEKLEYAINRYTNEAKRIYNVIDKQLGETPYIAGEYSIADIAIYPWLVPHNMQGQNLDDFPNLKKWYEGLRARPAVQAGFAVMSDQLKNRPPQQNQKAWDTLFGKTQFEKR